MLVSPLAHEDVPQLVRVEVHARARARLDEQAAPVRVEGYDAERLNGLRALNGKP